MSMIAQLSFAASFALFVIVERVVNAVATLFVRAVMGSDSCLLYTSPSPRD